MLTRVSHLLQYLSYYINHGGYGGSPLAYSFIGGINFAAAMLSESPFPALCSSGLVVVHEKMNLSQYSETKRKLKGWHDFLV